ncbi:MAG: polymorphic toxin-type HINT domain-containing protein, partial [Planctomycetaceae bacterium]|nr:polymorphic toxin-type HINT domain-containing protein [Planctomycetaceae bacterium]
EDRNRALEDYAAQQQSTVEQVNAAIAEGNRRIATVLSANANQLASHSPQEWWAWWAEATGVEVALLKQTVAGNSTKPVVEIQEIEIVNNPVVRVGTSCLPAGTPIHTELGPKPIETIQIGDRVLAKDIDTGELAYRPVLRTTVRSPQPLVKLSFRTETIQATRGHHFWVSGQGWRMARELRPGDRLHGLHGTVSVTDTATGDTAAVYNLVVDRANTYFVGDALVLSHDVTSPAPTNVKVPGLAVR